MNEIATMIAAVGVFGTMMLGVITFVFQRIDRSNQKKELVAQNVKIAEIKATADKVEHNTNSLTSDLVEAKALAAKLAGYLDALRDVKAESKEAAGDVAGVAAVSAVAAGVASGLAQAAEKAKTTEAAPPEPTKN